MKKKYGFTLVELLAVIVILAIVSVIAIPIIMGITEDSAKKTAKLSAYGALDAIRDYYTGMVGSDSPISLPLTIDFTNPVAASMINLSGAIPSSGSVTLAENGKFSNVSNLTINGYTCTYDATDQKFTSCEKR